MMKNTSKTILNHSLHYEVNTLRPGQNCRHFTEDISKCIFVNENIWISIKISLNLVRKTSINYIPALVKITASRRPSDNPLFEPMIASLYASLGLKELKESSTQVVPRESYYLINSGLVTHIFTYIYMCGARPSPETIVTYSQYYP